MNPANRAASRGAGDLHPARLFERLRTRRLGRAIVLFDTVESTNEVAMAAAAAGASAGTLFIAEEQTRGKGRRGRQWHSTAGKSLTVSLVLRPARRGEGLTTVLALAVVRALARSVRGLAIKWPNDIYLQGKKVGGVLAEAKGDAVVLGLGLNVNDEPADFPPPIEGAAVSLRIAAERRFDRRLVLARILETFEALYDDFERGGFAPLRESVEQRLLHIGRRAAIGDGAELRFGTVLGITDEGYIRLDVNGVERVFSSGDLTPREDSRGNDSRHR